MSDNMSVTILAVILALVFIIPLMAIIVVDKPAEITCTTTIPKTDFSRVEVE